MLDLEGEGCIKDNETDLILSLPFTFYSNTKNRFTYLFCSEQSLEEPLETEHNIIDEQYKENIEHIRVHTIKGNDLGYVKIKDLPTGIYIITYIDRVEKIYIQN